ncbi:MAG: GFA family protein [Gammaproteobacteria bacterium]
MSQTHHGSCFCGAVQLEVSGTPAAMGYCHCESCRHWSAGPINAFSLWAPEGVVVKSGEEHIDTYAKTENSERKWCKKCGGHLMTNHPGMGLVDVYAAILPTLEFEPMMHVFYSEKVVSVKDGLPKLADVPAEMGGSGDTLPE